RRVILEAAVSVGADRQEVGFAWLEPRVGQRPVGAGATAEDAGNAGLDSTDRAREASQYPPTEANSRVLIDIVDRALNPACLSHNIVRSRLAKERRVKPWNAVRGVGCAVCLRLHGACSALIEEC